MQVVRSTAALSKWFEFSALISLKWTFLTSKGQYGSSSEGMLSWVYLFQYSPVTGKLSTENFELHVGNLIPTFSILE